MNRDYVIADIHSHIFPEKIADKAVASIGSFYGFSMERAGRPEELDRLDAECGVSRSLVFSTATVPHQVQAINNYIADIVTRYPRFIGMGTLHPSMQDAEAEIGRMLSLGLRGVKFHPDFQNFDIDMPEMIPVYRAIARAGLPVLFHMGDKRYDHSHPRRLRKLLDAVPGLTVIAAHFGGYSVWDEGVEWLADTDAYVDTSSSLAFITPEHGASLIRRFGAGRCLFGSDYPMWDISGELRRFFALGLTDEENRAVLGGNFMRLFGLSSPV